MPKGINLNVSPYYDDYNPKKGYYQVLFKPGYPVQARELTTLQSMLQNQVEQFGSHVFKEGAKVTGGEVSYNNQLETVILENEYFGVSPEYYLQFISGKVIRGQTSNIRARIEFYINGSLSIIGKPTIYVTYLSSSSSDDTRSSFLSGETLIVEETVSLEEEFANVGSQALQSGEGFAIVNSTTLASAVYMNSGVYFIRGRFVSVFNDILLLDQYSNVPSYKVGLRIFEDIVNSYEDPTLNDNAQGFSNYAAPGADRLQIFAKLDKIDINDTNIDNFILLKEIRDGVDLTQTRTTEYSTLSQEFARRTFDESGDYYVKIPNISAKETLNNLLGNDGIFRENQITYNNNVPSESLGTYVISPMKAYVRGYEISTNGTTFIDFQKPRTTKFLQNQEVNYLTGPTYTLNRVYGTPILGLSTSYTVSLRNERVGTSQTTAPGEEIGLARVYDFALESGSYDTANANLNQWDIALYDVQTYTNIVLNEPITLSTPTHIKGKSSGAVGFLRYDSTNSGIITAYNTSGKFSVGEKLIFDGIENTRVSTAITEKSTNDIKSIYGIVGSAYTFTGDVKQSTLTDVGTVNISAASGGISTVTSPNTIFTGIATVGNLVSFTEPGLTVNTFSKIESVSQNAITISGVTTVTGVCEGALPSSSINPTDFKILTSRLQSSSDNTLYTVLPKRFISSIDLTDSNLVIRKQFNVTISSNSTGTITAGDNETFLPFDEERYALIREDGTTEELTQDKFVFSLGSKELTISGLGSNGNAKLIATLRKISVKSKIKNRNKVQTIVVDKSKYEGSGIGNTTLNDGLTYGNYAYGTRVQDQDICLLFPDVTKLYGVFESKNTSDPELPNIIFTSLDGPTNKVGDLLVGDTFIGQSSNAVGIYVERVNDLKINYVNLNTTSFVEGETVVFKESGISAVIGAIDIGDNNITSNYTLTEGLKNSIYDYSKVIRKTTSKEPTKKLKIVFEYASFLESDTGDITTVNSYEQYDYCDIGSTNNIRNSDLIDIRQRVAPYTVSENSRSPFEFLSRTFTTTGNSASNILASDESFITSYSFYLPRVDRIFLTKDGIFQNSIGEPSETPQVPLAIQDALEVATAYLPPYLCNINDINISLAEHKRYRMVDIQGLERRIENLEYYTALSLLEVDTSNLLIQDANGLNRFKAGFFVDDFSSTVSQKKVTGVKNSIDISNSQLRPTHYTTQTDLIIGTNTLIGIGTEANPLADSRFDGNLIGSGVKRTGQVLTLDYQEVSEINQPYSTRVQNVTPYSVSYYGGTIELFPSSDVWVDQVRLGAKTINAEGNYTETVLQLQKDGFDAQTGFGSVVWDSWQTVWTGEDTSKTTRTTTQGNTTTTEVLATTTRTGTSTRQGTRKVVKEQFDSSSLGDRVLNSQVIPFVRKRNIEITAKRMRPLTRLYTFFEGVSMDNYIIPKLIEISMVSGTFQVGETVIGSNSAGNTIKFRVAQQNHKYGAYNNPSDVFVTSPYDINFTIPSSYSSTSSILNVDTYSLSNQPEGSYYGYILSGLSLRGQTSGAEATITNVRLISDNVGTLIASLWIPDPNIDSNPRFESGSKTIRLTSDITNAQIPGAASTSAEETYYVEGNVNTVQENILVLRNSRVETETVSESKSVSESGPSTVISRNSSTRNTDPPEEPSPSTREYQGFAPQLGPTVTGATGIINQNVGGSQSLAYSGAAAIPGPAPAAPGTRAVLGAAAVERALADGYTLASIQAWVYREKAVVGPEAIRRWDLDRGDT